MILPLFEGAIVDRLGLRTSFILFFILNLVGNLIFAIGGSIESWTLMLVGRTVLGIGLYAMTLAVTVLVTKWFINSNLNLAYALMIITWGPATFLSGYVTPLLYGKQDDPHLGTSLFMGFWLNLASVVFLIVTITIDKIADDEL